MGAANPGNGYQPIQGVQGPPQPTLSSGFGSLPSKDGTYGLGNLTPQGAALVGQPAGNAPAPAAPAAPNVGFMTPAMQNYINQFNASQESQSQALNAGLLGAMQGLGQRRDAAAQVANALPASYEAAYKQSAADEAHAARQAVSAYGAKGKQAIGGGRDAAANAGMIAAEKASGASEVPFIQSGITADYSKGATTLSNTDMQNKAAIAQQQSQFDEQMALAQAQYQQQAAMQNSTFAHDASMAQLSSTLGVNANKAELGNQLSLEQKYGQLPATPQTSIQQANDQAAVSAGFPGGYTQLSQALSSPAYTTAAGKLSGNLGGSDRANYIRSITDQNVLLALQYSGLLLPSEVAAAHGMTLPAGVNPSHVG